MPSERVASRVEKIKRDMAKLEDTIDKVSTKHHSEQARLRRKFDVLAERLKAEIGKSFEATHGWKVGDVYYTGAFYDHHANKILVTRAVVTDIFVDADLYMSGKGDVYVQTMRPSGYNTRSRVTQIFKTKEDAVAKLLLNMETLLGMAARDLDSAVKVEDFDKKERGR